MDSRIDFNRDWEFVKSNVEWPDDFVDAANEMESVILPHTWNADDMVVGSEDPYVGGGWYRKEFMTPDLKLGQRLLIELEGVTNCHKVWVNGGYAGGRIGGFLTTLLDVTDLLEEDGNTVLVRADNSYEVKAAMPRHIDWNRYGGISRPVWLHVREHAYIDCAGVEIRTPEVSADAATTVVRTHVQETTIGGSKLEIRHTLTAPDGEVVSTTTTPMNTCYSLTNTIGVELPTVSHPQLWSDVEPTLYTLKTEILEKSQVIDSQTDRVGYRFFHFDADDGFFLNGKPTKLLGANIHIFFPGLGNALPERFHVEDMKLMKQMGCNYMRTSHYPRPKPCLDACDELGILVLEEQPYWHGSLRAFGGEEAMDNVPRLIQDMVRHHRNHPSIIIWNTVNEVMLAPAYKPGVGHLEPDDPRRAAWAINPKEFPYIRRHVQKMVDTFKRVDPDRPVSLVIGGWWQGNDDACLTSITDIVACNGGAMNFSKKPFVGPKTGKAYEFKPDYFRELYPKRIQLASEGVLNDSRQIHERGDWEREQTAWRLNAKYWSVMYQRPWYCGGSMWCFTDYSANGNIRLHGAVDQYRLPKDLFHFYAAMWADHPVLLILGHWNHNAGDSREVVVFTNCEDVELTLNGKSWGQGVSCADEYPGIPNAPLIWENIPFDEGTLEVRGSFGGTEVVSRRKTAGAPAQIQLTASNDTLIADGRDISYIDLTVCDEKDNRCYTTSAELSVRAEGAATLGGPSRVAASAGLARIAIRSNGAAGPITVSATGEGLETGRLSLTAE